jgi:mRNA interferase MazF
LRRGELYRVRRPGGDAKRQRAFAIVSRQVLIDSRFSTVICAPIYTRGEGLASQVAVGPAEGLKQKSWIMCDNLVSLRKADLTDYVGSLSPVKVAEMNRALRVALDLE